jgi:hypothetical protein
MTAGFSFSWLILNVSSQEAMSIGEGRISFQNTSHFRTERRSVRLFKRGKTSVEEWATGASIALIEGITDTNKTKMVGKQLSISSEEELTVLHRELTCLLVCSVDLAAYTALGPDADEKNTFLDIFYAMLDEHYHLAPADEKVFHSLLDDRLNAYAQLLNNSEKSGLAIGEAFSSFCGHSGDKNFANVASITSAVHLDEIRKLLTKHSKE